MLIGRLVYDVEVKNTVNGKKVSKLVLSVNRPFRNPKTDQIESDLFEVSIWDDLCDIAATYLKKGSKIAVKGRLQPQKATIESGANINLCQIIGEKIIFISSPETSEN